MHISLARLNRKHCKLLPVSVPSVYIMMTVYTVQCTAYVYLEHVHYITRMFEKTGMYSVAYVYFGHVLYVWGDCVCVAYVYFGQWSCTSLSVKTV